MDISNYTAQGLSRLQSGQDLATQYAAKGTQIRATNAPSGSPALSNGQQTSQTASEGGLFDTVLDTINPLQHLPGVSTAYQAATGDTSSPLSDMAGGFLFGGPVGLMAGAAKSFLEMLTGKSLADHATAFFGTDQNAPNGDDQVQLADTVQRDPLLSAKAAAGLSVQHYQAFAQAADQRHQGIGAGAAEVSWSDTIWTQRALKQATGLYESNQHLGGGAAGDAARRERLI